MKNVISWGVVAALALTATSAAAAVPSTLEDFFLPGSQPLQSGNLEHPSKCDNCHGGYDLAVEPAFNWRGSMMSQAARDPLFFACLAISNQDAPQSGDLCIRCHTPDGWLGGRSVPTDGSLLNAGDREGVQCDFCHKLVKPTPLGVNPYPGDPDYTNGTYPADQAYLANIQPIPPTSANGMYIADSNNAKRGPFVDAAARHQMLYSPFHRSSALCGTCHDVSNPAFVANPDGTFSPNDFGAPSPSFDPYSMFPVERTYSEWLMSEYNTPQGVYAPQFGGNKNYVSTCQDCHMKDVSGYGCNKNGAPFRHDLPLHDMTGGNTFIPGLVAQLFPGEVDPAALEAGIARARGMLQKAATVTLSVEDQGTSYLATVRVMNETGHKLPSGYPEGRRMWLNVKAFDAGGSLVYESAAYDPVTAELSHDADAKIYEIKPGISEDLAPIVGYDPGPSFHFVINNQIFSDNRIPPRGFTNENFELIQSPPVAYSYADGQYWDDTEYSLPAVTKRIEVTLYYQTISMEYVTFLRDANVTNDAGQVFYDLWAANGKSAPEAMNHAIYEIPASEPPVADFVGEPTSGSVPLSVSFTDLTTGGPNAWSWEFGDGGVSGEQNPVHLYQAPGVYTVSLTATNPFGSDTETKTGYITVSEGLAMHVAAISVVREAGGGNRFRAAATVTIVDQWGDPVPGALVTGDFTGPFPETRSGTTNDTGQAVILSRWIKNPSGTWCFTVTSVTRADATYDPGSNVVTQGCEGAGLAKFGAAVEEPSFGLLPANPNPFRSATDMRFALPIEGHAVLEVFGVGGEKVATLVNGPLGAGVHTVRWDAGEIASGVYLCRLEAGSRVDVQTITLLK